jgi:hypothetical protein
MAMFDPDSRYAGRPVKTHVDAEGREIAYVARRLIPRGVPAAAETRVEPGDRLDLIAERAYGDARLSWRVMDANPDPEPLTLADTPGRRLRLAGIGPGD